jgi:type II secretory pathway pseudopilin PulG
MRPTLRAQAGFGYFSVILAIAVLGVALAGIGELWSTQAQREREAELLRIGNEIRRAIISYHASTRAGTPSFPTSLDDLLEDRRGPQMRRHLRKLYADPMTRSTEWGLVKLPDGRIRGVFSRSVQAPLKTAKFPLGLEKFDEAKTYADWQFEYIPRTSPGGAARR